MSTLFMIEMMSEKYLRRGAVLARWLRRQTLRFKLAAAFFAFMLVFPLGVVGGVKVSSFWSSGEALAATRSFDSAPRTQFFKEILTDGERLKLAEKLFKRVKNRPGKIYGMKAEDLAVMFDMPHMERREGNALIWQFLSDVCVLDVYFSTDGTKLEDVVYMTARARQTAYFDAAIKEKKMSEKRCMKDIFEMQQAKLAL